MARINKQFGGRIKQARQSRGWSHRDVAHRAGTSHTTVGNWERGEIPSVPDSVREIADALEIPRVPLLRMADYGVRPEDEEWDRDHYENGSFLLQPAHGRTGADESELRRALRSLGGEILHVRAFNIGHGIPDQRLYFYRCTGKEELDEFAEGALLAFAESTVAPIGKWVLVEEREEFHLRVNRGPSTGRIVGYLVGEMVPRDVEVPDVLIQ